MYTYNNLLYWLQQLTPEQLNMTVTIYNMQSAEYYPASFSIDQLNVLGENYPIILEQYNGSQI